VQDGSDAADPWVKLLPHQAQLDHHPLLSFVINHEMAMEEKAAVFLKVRARDGLAPRIVGVEGRGPQDDVLAVEGAVALADRHRRLPRVVPHGGEAIRFGIEAGNSSYVGGEVAPILLRIAMSDVLKGPAAWEIFRDGGAPNRNLSQVKTTLLSAFRTSHEPAAPIFTNLIT
jgi:hypothetical protein